jgi:hypothetical protein
LHCCVQSLLSLALLLLLRLALTLRLCLTFTFCLHLPLSFYLNLALTRLTLLFLLAPTLGFLTLPFLLSLTCAHINDILLRLGSGAGCFGCQLYQRCLHKIRCMYPGLRRRGLPPPGDNDEQQQMQEHADNGRHAVTVCSENAHYLHN